VNPDIPLDGFFLLTEYTWGMTSHIHPLCRSRKLAALIVSLFLTASPSLLGCSIADRAAPIDDNYRVVERVIDGDTVVMEDGERVRLIGVDTPKQNTPTNPLSTSAKGLPPLHGVW
jgi:hypothetical protein